MNRLVARYGNPEHIYIELGRELKYSAEKKKELAQIQNKNQKINEKLRLQFHEAFGKDPSRDDIIKMKLWQELGVHSQSAAGGKIMRCCPYTGQPISFRHLFDEGEIEVEHILPFSQTLDDSLANKTVSFRQANRDKGNQSPYKAFGHKADQWAIIVENAKHLPRNKRWRFQEDAWDIFERRLLGHLTHAEKQAIDDDRQGAFLARQLIDNQYISKLAQRYLTPLVGSKYHIIPTNGQITAMIRKRWKLNRLLNKAPSDSTEQKESKSKTTGKNRDDHRHHALDAVVVGLTDRGMIQRIATENAKEANRKQNRVFIPMPKWLHPALQDQWSKIMVSYKPDHSFQGNMFKETAFGFTSPKSQAYQAGYKTVVRQTIASLSAETIKEQGSSEIRDRKLAEDIRNFIAANNHLKLEEALKKYSDSTGVKRVRVVKRGNEAIPIASAPYKGYEKDSLAFCDIWKVPKTNKKREFAGKWDHRGAFLTYAEALPLENSPTQLLELHKPHPAAKHLMRLYKNDTVVLEESGEQRFYRVAGFATVSNTLDIRPLYSSSQERLFVSINQLCANKDMHKVIIQADGSYRILQRKY